MRSAIMPTIFSVQKKLTLAKIEAEATADFIQKNHPSLVGMDLKGMGLEDYKIGLEPIQHQLQEDEVRLNQVTEQLRALKEPQGIKETLQSKLPGAQQKIVKLEKELADIDRHCSTARETLAHLNRSMRTSITSIIGGGMQGRIKKEIDSVSKLLNDIGEYNAKMTDKKFLDSYPGDYNKDAKQVLDMKTVLQTYKRKLMADYKLYSNTSTQTNQNIDMSLAKPDEQKAAAERKVANQTRFMQDTSSYKDFVTAATEYQNQLGQVNTDLKDTINNFSYGKSITLGVPGSVLRKADFIDRPQDFVKPVPEAAENLQRKGTLSAEDIAALKTKFTNKPAAEAGPAEEKPKSPRI